MSQHNLKTVVGFEFLRTVTKKRFWLATLAIPVAVVIAFALIVISNETTSTTASNQKNAQLTFTFSDDSGLVTDAVATGFGGTRTTDPDRAIADVKSGAADAYFAYPANPATQPVRV